MADFPSNHPSPFDLSDYILSDEGPVDCPISPIEGLVSPVAEVGNLSNAHSTSYAYSGGGGGGDGDGISNSRGEASERGSAEAEHRVAFRTKSEVEIMDDGFKWRKYGKKSVKNSPNPRNYYRCSTEGCSVKKRVERDPEDPSYVITTYEGTHNHPSPDVVYYATQDSESGRFVLSGCQQIPRSS